MATPTSTWWTWKAARHGGSPHARMPKMARGAARPLARGPQMSFAPRFSPDGRRIAFSMPGIGNPDTNVWDGEGAPPRRLTTIPGTDTAPSFSPDGTQIV